VSERLAFDYVIIQVVPRVDRDERLNVGVVLFSPAASFLGCRFAADDVRLRLLAPDLELAVVTRQLEAIAAICRGDAEAGPIARLSPSERFHWLSAPRSTVVQPSAAHTGLCDDPATALDRAFTLAVVSSPSPSPIKVS
jgi:hypothetical protein